MIVVFDTNIWIAASLEGIYALELVNLGLTGRITIAISQSIVEEIRGKLSKKFHWQDFDINDFVDFVQKSSVMVEPKKSVNVVKADPKDNHIIACAIEAKAGLIITSDKHLLKLKKFKKIAIVHSRSMRWIFPDVR